MIRSSSACNSSSGRVGSTEATTARGFLPPKLASPCTVTSNGFRLMRSSSEAISLAELGSMSPMKRSVTW